MPENRPPSSSTAENLTGLAEIFLVFARIGLFTFGGGLVMLPLIERSVVEEKSWQTAEEFNEMLAVTNALPGAFAINAAIAIGRRRRGIPGAVIGGLGVMLPSFVVILILAWLLLQGQDIVWLNKFFLGLRPVVVALLADAALRLGKRNIRGWMDWLILTAGAVLIVCTGINAALIILAGGLIGLSYYRRRMPPRPSSETPGEAK